jgi:glycosyltransferase involved in cell wall biosynthesis
MKKIVFLVNSMGAPRCTKRIEEFIQNGYEVETYGFKRTAFSSDSINGEIIGVLDEGNGYLKRLFIIPSSLFPIFKKHKTNDVIYYIFGLNIALFAVLMTNKKFVYEESDMTHLNIKNKMFSGILECLNKRIIKRSLQTVFTSEGFLKYHYKDVVPNNISVIPNKLNIKVKQYEILPKKVDVVSFGFVGAIRYKTVYQFAEIIGKHFEEKEFHFFGNFASPEDEVFFSSLKKYKNVVFHGKFQSPQDLNQIYSKINIVVATYDITSENVKWAEPNKLYEGIYFETPIVVSKGTYLAEKVQELDIGYEVDVNNINEVIDFIKNLSQEDIRKKTEKCKMIPKEFCINNNTVFFDQLRMDINN